MIFPQTLRAARKIDERRNGRLTANLTSEEFLGLEILLNIVMDYGEQVDQIPVEPAT